MFCPMVTWQLPPPSVEVMLQIIILPPRVLLEGSSAASWVGNKQEGRSSTAPKGHAASAAQRPDSSDRAAGDRPVWA